ncbi:hypothetical protein PS645_02078 [Pseudomonas fluorescens]|uniref:DUF3203 domain-containing protein n=1 Tax=Pseudomonas fluorescens TaxID=294 RepID=A0A5E6SMH0_PSEFL|nr:DUF3203 family protein [Pseudomonas fluorescens]VVM77238.1 hypothetical protein PS645_02078 [Pseudomonas fluorescens]
MAVRTQDKTVFFTTDTGEEIRLAEDLVVITDPDMRMSAVDVDGRRIFLTEAEVDMLTVAGAKDGRENLKETDSDSVV